MSSKHGNKIHLQILLDPARALLLEQIAEDKSMRVTALARQAIYDWLRFISEPEVIDAADAIDQARWQQSVKNRIEGRKRNREMRLLTQELV